VLGAAPEHRPVEGLPRPYLQINEQAEKDEDNSEDQDAFFIHAEWGRLARGLMVKVNERNNEVKRSLRSISGGLRKITGPRLEQLRSICKV
jgi:hypothetical protein